MEERNQELYPAWKQAVENVVSEFEYGDLIPFEWFYENLHITKPYKATEAEYKRLQCRLFSDIESIKRELLEEHHIYLTNVRGEGYLLTMPNDQSNVVWSKMKKALYKALRQSNLGLVHVEYDMLSNEERRNNANKLAHLAGLRIMTRRGIKNERENILHTGTEDPVSGEEAGADSAGQAEEEKGA